VGVSSRGNTADAWAVISVYLRFRLTAGVSNFVCFCWCVVAGCVLMYVLYSADDLVSLCTNNPGHLRQLGVSSADMKLLVPAFYRTEAVQTRRRQASSGLALVARGGDETTAEDGGLEGGGEAAVESLVGLLRPVFCGGDREEKSLAYARALVAVGVSSRGECVSAI
jgi:hypothetical protein